MSALLRSKVQLPPLRSQHILRQRIQQHIDTTPDARLVLVSAPAGFGKSSALIEWAHDLQARDVHVAWYALDEHDNDPTRFAAYLLQACHLANHDWIPQPTNETQSDIHTTCHHILNAAMDAAAPIVLILDDYHLIREPKIHDAVGRMCEHLPPNMRLAIGTRADPPLQLARLRTQREMTEIRMTDLRFSTPETGRWLQTILGWQPSDAFLSELDALTEGWAAALTLIVTGQSGADEETLRAQLARFSQSRRHIFDYFAQEILDQQSEEIRQFLLNTCVLDQLEPDLCRALTDNARAPLLLEQLAMHNLFIIPLSNDTPVYRYHHLFAHFLRHYLHLQDAQHHAQQHHRASLWYADHDQIIAAVHHALDAHDHDRAAMLITDHAWETLTARGEIMTVIHWIVRFPEDDLPQYPRLCLYFSRALYLIGDMDKAHHYVQLAADSLATKTQQHPALQAIALGYQATLAAYRGDVREGLDWIEQANQLADHVGGVDRVRIANTDAFLRYMTDTIPAARQAYQMALSLAEAIEHDFLTLDAHFYLAQIDLLSADLQAVEDRCTRLLSHYADKNILPLSAVMVPLARVQTQRNQLVEAEATLRDAIKLARRANLPDILWFAYMNLASILSVNDFDEAQTMLAQARTIARDFHSPVMASIIAASEAQLMLRSGQLEAAVAWAAQFHAKTAYHQQHERTIQARIDFASGNHERALALVTHLIENAQANGRIWYVIAGNILQALIHRAADDSDAALVALEHALKLAQPQRIVRLFLQEGQPMQTMLRQAVGLASVGDYAAYLLDIAADDDRMQHPADVLTEREIEVLQHIADGQSNSDIADALFISIGTVKSHVHHIMNKLDAQNRTEAVSKARSLNILPE